MIILAEEMEKNRNNDKWLREREKKKEQKK